MGGARLLSVAGERAAQIVTNDDLAQRLDTNDAWIRSRSGIARRRVAAAPETVEALGLGAAAKAVSAAGIDPLDIGLVLLATSSQPTPVPGAAPVVALGVGATNAVAFDINAGCAGFCTALGLAADSVRAGTTLHALVVGSERMTDIVDQDDRATAVLFGDGAGAVVVGPSETDEIGPVSWGTDATGAPLLTMPADTRHLFMDGQAVYRWATTALADKARDAVHLAGISPRDLRGFVPHQANLRIVNALVKELDLDPACVISDDVVDAGNTSAASVPLGLSRLIEEGRLQSGDPVLLFAFGAGLTWAGQVVRVP